MDFDGGLASLPFRSLEEAAASVGRGPDPAGTAGGRGSPAAGDRARRGHASSMLLARTPPRRADFLGRSTKGDVLFFENNWSHWQEAATLHRTREPLPGYQTMLLN
ncbi:small membrane A-kinase anchor protein isoform X1 [Motacilla alba alba]|uniref:small membrane A-kinase anchor protein isoform X1 n=1 Tax=Motacilla alba alba TaxID=1094192 RepID=UPI0018D5372F|nr:small membrane A-kinase anchor protein isoform X1 [Motacilla alba alba]